MSLSAASEIFLLPLSVTLTTADKEWQKGRLDWPVDAASQYQVDPLLGDRSAAAGNQLSLDGCFLADKANSLLRVFDDLTCLDSCYSPIVLFGPSQTGKSLLSRGVAQRLANIRAYRRYQLSSEAAPSELPAMSSATFSGRAVCLSAADWSRQLQEAVETNSLADFRQRFTSAGTVQIDDLTLLENSPFSQEQLVILLDLLATAGVPVFATSERHPSLLENFRSDLISRLLGGLVLPVNLPGAAAKQTYLVERANRLGLNLSADSFKWLVNQAPLPTFAALEGFLQELSVRCKLCERVPTLSELQAHFQSDKPESVENLADLVVDTAAEFFELSAEQLKSPCRRQTTVLARGLALTLAKRLWPLSLNALGQLVGDRDHSTVLSALQVTERRLKTDSSVRSALVEIFNRVKAKAVNLRIALNLNELEIDLICGETKLKETT